MSCLPALQHLLGHEETGAILYYAMLCYAMLFYSILFYSILFYSILCYAMLVAKSNLAGKIVNHNVTGYLLWDSCL
jgi:hypothetical protein